ncbi:helix-turn-helix transcriptional regulator [Catenuloplanes atrovinosus]|uniref:DNA-binding PadR family transcriptional regulator n=1 Tax=Catenuloplanes atrovinosus TaxID=137266 RepID=A0AAE4CDU7_9ACTN|nr:helix-turn-helix transcriptional regulator [Catenuloplanes atrovinosus]MDR7280991.1 DNA-binding PadR family transcriptional regulator [Catenuloplanes atrovinosus]
MTAVFSHGRLRLYLLKLLDDGPKHGYEFIRLLENRFLGLYAPSAGTIYPRLARLEAEGLVTHTAAGARKTYEITEAGRAELLERADELQALEAEISASISDLSSLAGQIQSQVQGSVRDLKRELRDATRQSRRARSETSRWGPPSAAAWPGWDRPAPGDPAPDSAAPGGAAPGGAVPGGAAPGRSGPGGPGIAAPGVPPLSPPGTGNGGVGTPPLSTPSGIRIIFDNGYTGRAEPAGPETVPGARSGPGGQAAPGHAGAQQEGEGELGRALGVFVDEAQAMIRGVRATEAQVREVGEVLDATLTRIRRLLRD